MIFFNSPNEENPELTDHFLRAERLNEVSLIAPRIQMNKDQVYIHPSEKFSSFSLR